MPSQADIQITGGFSDSSKCAMPAVVPKQLVIFKRNFRFVREAGGKLSINAVFWSVEAGRHFSKNFCIFFSGVMLSKNGVF